MKLITLNCWGGRRHIPLLDFFEREKSSCDIFCLQEVFDASQDVLNAKHADMQTLRGDLYRLITEVLSDFQGYLAHFEDRNRMCTAIFVRRTVPVYHAWDAVVHTPEVEKHEGKVVISPRKLQCLKVGLGDKELLIANLHGMWVNGPKTDTPERIAQSKKVKKIMDAHSGPSILCGDFNLLPDTESVAILAEGRRDLVKQFGITSTRTPLYRHYDNPDEPNFADYVMTSIDLTISRFGAMFDEVSDHSPLHVSFH